MKILAKALKGREFMYDYTTAHSVSARSAKAICDILNEYKYDLNSERQVWHIYDIDEWEFSTIEYAKNQKFYIYRGRVTRKYSA